jgi:hypothetical protein
MFGWLARCRFLAMDFENITRTQLAYGKLAVIRLTHAELSTAQFRSSDGAFTRKYAPLPLFAPEPDEARARKRPVRRARNRLGE